MQYRPRKLWLANPVFAMMSCATQADAHASEQGFVLLLPTDVYITAGVASVALTVLLLTVLPARALRSVFRPMPLVRWKTLAAARNLTSCLSLLLLCALVWLGMTGPRDPLTNPLPLAIWTLWWIGLVSLQGLIGDLWRWIDPWRGPVTLTRHLLWQGALLRLPASLGHSCAILTYLGFVIILLADPAPSDPARLARYVGLYWLFTYLALLIFGPRWHLRGEGIAMLMRCYATVGVFGRYRNRIALGLTGWQAARNRAPAIGAAVFMLVLLGCGSFDGLNETFWWLGLLGINPLEFPGRSAVVTQNIVGLLVANMALIAAYGIAIWLGLRLAGNSLRWTRAFRIFAPTILPIALGYHVGHYLTSMLVNGQYALAALNDPLARGDSLLGLGTFYVTTGFFNAQDSVRVIWLCQAGAVVVGHILAILMAHLVALRQFETPRQATLSQLPLAVFMVCYTVFGLWLLAAPRGL
ncbi:hypothetical protein QO231_00660 [Sedimentitalea todarodis]|uniref:Fenitrothion hydrolase n=1 Tax=Sedimentitalea todarodis TaxID=1631240 RepID=A0ABU3V861_9RHOB|nr:hypothetical protein [Sedimentitalea todarodis]